MRGITALKVPQDIVGTPQPSFWTLNAVEPCSTYPNLYLVRHSLALIMESFFFFFWCFQNLGELIQVAIHKRYESLLFFACETTA